MKNFEENLKRLEELTNAIKQSDISLEDALKNFEEGIKLAHGMEKELDSIEGKIQILMNEPSCAEDTSDFEKQEQENEEALEGKADEAQKPKKARAKKQKEAKESPVLELFNGSSHINGTRNE